MERRQQYQGCHLVARAMAVVAAAARQWQHNNQLKKTENNRGSGSGSGSGLIVIGFCCDLDELPYRSSGDVVFLKMLQELKTHLDLFGGCYVSSDFHHLHKWIVEQKELFLQSRKLAGKDITNSSRLEMLKEAGIDFSQEITCPVNLTLRNSTY